MSVYTPVYKYDAYDHWYWIRYYCFWPRYLSVGVGTLDVEAPIEVRVSVLVTLGAGGILCGVAGIHAGHSELVRKDVQYHLVMVGHDVPTHTTTKIYQNISMYTQNLLPSPFIKDILLLLQTKTHVLHSFPKKPTTTCPLKYLILSFLQI